MYIFLLQRSVVELSKKRLLNIELSVLLPIRKTEGGRRNVNMILTRKRNDKIFNIKEFSH